MVFSGHVDGLGVYQSSEIWAEFKGSVDLTGHTSPLFHREKSKPGEKCSGLFLHGGQSGSDTLWFLIIQRKGNK